jgi:hypothetical protein
LLVHAPGVDLDSGTLAVARRQIAPAMPLRLKPAIAALLKWTRSLKGSRVFNSCTI